MLTATDLELAAGGRLLISSVSFQIRPGDRIGLVGRNGAGKTSLAKVLAGEALPAAGSLRHSGGIAYLPQDPRTGDLAVAVRDRVLAARGLDVVVRDLADMAAKMGTSDEDARDAALARYSRLEERFIALGGWAAEADDIPPPLALRMPTRPLPPPDF